MKRRAFLAGLGLAGVGTVLRGTRPRTVSAMSTARRARVVTVRRPDVFGNGRGSDVRKLGIDAKLVRQMVHESVTALLGTKTSDDAWKKLFGPRDVVGVKINCLGGRMLSSHPAVVAGIVEGLRAAGVRDNNIIVWDRFSRELRAAGFAINVTGDGVKYLGTDERGYRYTSEPIVYRSIGSCFSMILASRCNAIISVPLLKDHDIAGVTLNLKNFFGVVQKAGIYHEDRCDPFIADLNAHPLIKDKNRLIICDALTGVYDGGPGYNPDAVWKYGGVMASTDAVALDRVGATIVEKKRSEAGEPPLKDVGREPVHIHTAAKLGLGCDDPDKIEVVEV